LQKKRVGKKRKTRKRRHRRDVIRDFSGFFGKSNLERRDHLEMQEDGIPTEKLSTIPNSRNIQAQNTIDAVNAKLPSTVLDVVGDQRCIPIRLPTIEACDTDKNR